MKLVLSQNFEQRLIEICDFIALDNRSRAINFGDMLLSEIESIVDMPLAYRIDPNANRQDVRNLIYKGYVVVFRIDKIAGEIRVLDIFKENLPKGNYDD